MNLFRYVRSTQMGILIRTVADATELTKENLRDFLDISFEKVTEKYEVCKDYQRRAAKFGEAFEECFKVIMETLFPDIKLEPDVMLSEACMMDGGKADFVIWSGKPSNKKIVAVIEAKGAADYIICNGKRVELERPGLIRTDTVKKAICNAYQVSRAYPDALFFIVTSHKPTGGNAKCMCNLAEGDIVNKIVDVTNPLELEEMVKIIRNRLLEFS